MGVQRFQALHPAMRNRSRNARALRGPSACRSVARIRCRLARSVAWESPAGHFSVASLSRNRCYNITYIEEKTPCDLGGCVKSCKAAAKEKSLIPKTYDQWHHCITVECGLALTRTFIAQRLAVWRNAQSEETLRFRRLYGDQHWKSVMAWFEQASLEPDARE
ncbi:hypothetical protein [Pseudorhodoferax sp.]|uniref:hypothetical protein n=1 Tax=Pseudorhodoferax sp. TaxID=1993553 RepID=UPI0039E430FD